MSALAALLRLELHPHLRGWQRSRVVLETPVEAGAGQIKAMAKMIGHPNNRPVQPLNARIVIEED